MKAGRICPMVNDYYNYYIEYLKKQYNRFDKGFDEIIDKIIIVLKTYRYYESLMECKDTIYEMEELTDDSDCAVLNNIKNILCLWKSEEMYDILDDLEYYMEER